MVTLITGNTDRLVQSGFIDNLLEPTNRKKR